MANINTKQKIINAALDLFNENGMANVRLQQIADEIGISPGNLAYHFKNKEAIVESVQEDIIEQVSAVLSTYRIFPNLMDFDNQLSKYFAFTKSHPFYFLDLLEIDRHYPAIHAKRQVHISKMISQIRKRFDFNQQRGLIKKETSPELYDEIANVIWVLITFWVAQNVIRRSNQVEDMKAFKKMVWNQMYPFFTKAGIAEFEQLIVPILNQRPSENY